MENHHLRTGKSTISMDHVQVRKLLTSPHQRVMGRSKFNFHPVWSTLSTCVLPSGSACSTKFTFTKGCERAGAGRSTTWCQRSRSGKWPLVTSPLYQIRNMVLLYVYLQNSMEHRDMDQEWLWNPAEVGWSTQGSISELRIESLTLGYSPTKNGECNLPIWGNEFLHVCLHQIQKCLNATRLNNWHKTSKDPPL